mmetsp:Transcript_109302/g.308428  ORF Transcript_109302/g.308428 Transcript_109302/m.308428 type:complete len:119 (-) Transcript_109302:742-1098(-)
MLSSLQGRNSTRAGDSSDVVEELQSLIAAVPPIAKMHPIEARKDNIFPATIAVARTRRTVLAAPTIDITKAEVARMHHNSDKFKANAKMELSAIKKNEPRKHSSLNAAGTAANFDSST